MKLNTIIKTVTVATSLALAATPASAEGQLRGAMTAVNNVASAMVSKNSSQAFKWGKKSEINGPVANTSERAKNSSFRWASKNQASGTQTASVNGRVDAEQSGSRWVLRNDAEQSGSRWVLRNDAEQSGSRWVLRNDAEQSGSRWVLR